MEIETVKKQFLMVFSNDGRYQWASEYKKQYIYALRQTLDNAGDDEQQNPKQYVYLSQQNSGENTAKVLISIEHA